jgi:hypothetical protein
MCTLGTVVTLDQGDGDDEVREFWAYLGKGPISPAVPDSGGMSEFAPILYRIGSHIQKPPQVVASGTSISNGSADNKCFPREALDDSGVFLLDAGWDIFVWIGTRADLHGKVAAIGAADRYAELEPRAKLCPITILKAGQETSKFLSFFE